jgi:predicted nucleotidyltransferase component of viral defense system
MISRKELEKVKETRGTSLYYAEKEYLQYIFLHAISRYGDFVFKGGTCLRICYDMERASEDLDFSTSLDANGMRTVFAECMKDFERLNITHEKPVEKEFKGNVRFEVRFHGPLYDGDRKSTNTLKIDFSRASANMMVPKVAPRLFSDIPVFTLSALDESEILAEKIRALAARAQPRDLYDVWMLLQTGVKIDKALLKEKLAEGGNSLHGIKFPGKGEYELDLGNLLLSVPSYCNVKKEVETELGKVENDQSNTIRP